MVEWQPIETAPRDGSHVLVVMHDGSVGFGWFGGRNVPMQTVAHWWSNPGEEGWYPSVGAGDADPLSPTHWKPLDEPQELREENEELRKALAEAVLQIEYLHGRFEETGSGNTVIARSRALLSR
jgi:hypothetical protein